MGASRRIRMRHKAEEEVTMMKVVQRESERNAKPTITTGDWFRVVKDIC